MIAINLGDDVFFLFKDKVREATLVEKVITETWQSAYAGKTTKISYEIDNNPAGSQYTKRFSEGELFSSKQELLEAL